MRLLALLSLRDGELGRGVLTRSIGAHVGGARLCRLRSRELRPCTPCVTAPRAWRRGGTRRWSQTDAHALLLAAGHAAHELTMVSALASRPSSPIEASTATSLDVLKAKGREPHHAIMGAESRVALQGAERGAASGQHSVGVVVGEGCWKGNFLQV
jgi:hypothetical protein